MLINDMQISKFSFPKVFSFSKRKALGQGAFEYMMIVGLVMLIIIPIGAYVWQQNEISLRTQQAQIAANTIANTADNLWAQGPGARSTITVLLPNGYIPGNSFVSNTLVVISVNTPAGTTDAAATTRANMTGSLPVEYGYKNLLLEVSGSNVVVSQS